MKRMHRPLLTVLATGMALVAHAHPGGLNKEGCHNNRKTGEYHCHRGAPDTLAPPGQRQDGPAHLSPAAPERGNSTPGRPFRNCAEARAYGAAPVRRGDPGYGPHLDRDNDGVGCEPYRGR